MQKNQGERPLKHWKRLQVFNIKGTVSTMAQCVVKTEDGKFDEIVKNLPAQVPEFMAAFAAQAAAITNLQTELSAHLAETRRATVATASEEDLETYLQEVLADRLQPQTDKCIIQEKALALQKLLAYQQHATRRLRHPKHFHPGHEYHAQIHQPPSVGLRNSEIEAGPPLQTPVLLET